jgi:hypothetical protein
MPQWTKLELLTPEQAARGAGSGGPLEEAARPDPARLLQQRSTPRRQLTETRLPAQTDLEKYFGDRPLPAGLADRSANSTSVSDKIMVFSGSAVELADSVLAEASALRGLSERYGGIPGNELGPGPAATLAGMLEDHLRDLRQMQVRIQGAVAPVLNDIARERGLGASLGQDVAGYNEVQERSGGWSETCLRLFSAADRVHRNTMALFAVQMGTSPPAGQRDPTASVSQGEDQAIAELLHSLDTMKTEAEIAERELARKR